MVGTLLAEEKTKVKREAKIVERAPDWYKDAIFYELRVRSFFDSDGDGIGDLRGAAQKLDYIQELGVTTVWLLPFYPSPLKDDGYDIADYMDIHPDYGTLADFRFFLKEAHRRGLRVVTELVLNHTSDQHPWFQRARNAKPGSRWRDFYLWSDTQDHYPDMRIIFKDFERSNFTWDHVAQAFFCHRFYSHQPDLNYDNPEVKKAVFQVVDFWLGMGVDGLRLDAVPYLFKREGTNCENLPETHSFLKELRKHIDAKFSDRMLLAEANQWPEDVVAYFGEEDECHMAFHFPVMPRMFMSIQLEDRFPIVDILQQTPHIPSTCQWAIFLRNHDELTLEMVTDEERDYMYRMYAHDPRARVNLGIRRRLAPLLGGDRRKTELMNGLLFSMPGTPIIYYGEEIGMGDNIYLGDRDSVRMPMQWSSDRNAGFSRTSPQKLYLPIVIEPEYHYEAINVENQQSNPHSLLWWMKRLISLRRRYQAFGRGSLEMLDPKNPKVLAFIRRYEQEILLVVVNFSRFSQFVELDLSSYRGLMPIELFGRTEFPLIGELPYLLTLGSHTFYWLQLEEPSPAAVHIATPVEELPTITISESFENLLVKRNRPKIETVLLEYLKNRRWFRGKARKIKEIKIIEAIEADHLASAAHLVLLKVDYTQEDSEVYVLPLGFLIGHKAEELRGRSPHAVIAVLKVEGEEGIQEGLLFDAIYEKEFPTALLEAMTKRRNFKRSLGQFIAKPTSVLRRLQKPSEKPLEPSVIQAEQSNTSVIFGDQLVLKFIRCIHEGVNPELEMGRFLTEKTSFPNISRTAGFVEYAKGRNVPMTVATLQEFVPNQGDAWQYTLDELERYFDRARAAQIAIKDPILQVRPLLEMVHEDPPQGVLELMTAYLESARLMGIRTAEMHNALSSRSDIADFCPEPFTTFYQRSLYQSMRGLALKVFRMLRSRLSTLPEATRTLAESVLAAEGTMLNIFEKALLKKVRAMRIRCHGDYHLGQLLYTGKDFVIIDFEGEPARSLSERRIKRSPLADVTGMLRSFHYASHTTLLQEAKRTVFSAENASIHEAFAKLWRFWASSAFLKAYLKTAESQSLLPEDLDTFKILLQAFMLEKAIYEVGYELNNRPDWVHLPLAGIEEIL